MQLSIKKCPQCQMTADINATICQTCGHQFSTQFAQANPQTQAFQAVAPAQPTHSRPTPTPQPNQGSYLPSFSPISINALYWSQFAAARVIYFLLWFFSIGLFLLSFGWFFMLQQAPVPETASRTTVLFSLTVFAFTASVSLVMLAIAEGLKWFVNYVGYKSLTP